MMKFYFVSLTYELMMNYCYWYRFQLSLKLNHFVVLNFRGLWQWLWNHFWNILSSAVSSFLILFELFNSGLCSFLIKMLKPVSLLLLLRVNNVLSKISFEVFNGFFNEFNEKFSWNCCSWYLFSWHFLYSCWIFLFSISKLSHWMLNSWNESVNL